MTIKVKMAPQLSAFKQHESGIRRVVEAYYHYGPAHGIEYVGEKATSYDLRASHAGCEADVDVAHCHGVYWSGEAGYVALGYEWQANRDVIDSLRRARIITVPSPWVQGCFQRDMRLNPLVIPHGIEWEEWQHDQPNEGYVLWNKNRSGDACDPTPVLALAQRLEKQQFRVTFPTVGRFKRPNITSTGGVIPHAQMKRLLQRAAVYLATTKETFGIGTLEAMASGIPILGYQWGATPDLVEHLVTGYLAVPGDAEDLQRGLEWCLAHRQEAGDAARIAARSYTWDYALSLVYQAYQQAYCQQQEPAAVTIVIPIHNYADVVERAVRSVQAQTWTDWECILVDDGSTDDSYAVAQRLVSNDPRIRAITQPNQGVAHARNNGIALGTAPYVCCLDADDEIMPQFLTACVTALQQDRALALAYTGLLTVRADGGTSPSNWPGACDFDAQCQGRNQVPTCNVFRRSIWERLGGYRQRYAPHGAGAEDAEFWLRIGLMGGEMRQVTTAPFFHYHAGTGHVGKLVAAGQYTEPDWKAWHPELRDGLHPFASRARPVRLSHPVRAYDQPAVSIIIPVGPGHESLLVDALDSLEAQTFRNWEAIVINDTGQPLNLTAYPYARTVDTERTGMGPGHARNLGLKLARAPLFVCLDADDYLQPGYLTEVLGAWQKEPGQPTWVYTDLFILHPDGRSEEFRCSDFDPDILWRRGIAAVTCLYPVALWQQVGGFAEDILREDWEFQLRLAKAGACAIHVAQLLFTYRHATGQRARQQAKEEVTRLRGLFPREELLTMCGGCKKGKNARLSSVADLNRFGIYQTNEGGGVLLEYAGKNQSDVTYRGANGKRIYRFGNNQSHRQHYVHPDDVEWFLAKGMFKAIPAAPRAPLVQAQANPAQLLAKQPVVQVSKTTTAPPAPPSSAVPAPFVVPEAPEELDAVELVSGPVGALQPGAYSLAQLRTWQKTSAVWAALLVAEHVGKQRKGAIAFLTRMMEAGQYFAPEIEYNEDAVDQVDGKNPARASKSLTTEA